MVHDKFKRHKFHKNHKFKPTHHIGQSHNKHSKFSIGKLFYNIKRFVRKNPIFCSITSMIFAVVLVRLAFLNSLFGRNLVELRFWIIFFAIVFFIIGAVSIRVWMKNNVSNFNMNFTHKRR